MKTNHPAHDPVSLNRLLQISEILSKAAAQSDGGNLGYAMADAVKVIDVAIAAFGAEPVLYAAPPAPVYQYREIGGGVWEECGKDWFDHCSQSPEHDTRTVYAAQPASERERIRREHAEWSQATFGNVGPIGPLKHLSKEALEAAAVPGDLSEWADMQFLLWDAQRRTGISDEQITQAMVEKLAVNKQRKWPEPKDGEPRLHIKEQPAPVVPDGYCIMPVALTAKNGAKWALSGEFSTAREVTSPECEGDGCSDCDGRGDWYEDQAIDWTTIKEIYRRAVEVCALPTGQTQDKIA